MASGAACKAERELSARLAHVGVRQRQPGQGNFVGEAFDLLTEQLCKTLVSRALDSKKRHSACPGAFQRLGEAATGHHRSS
eukprot:scaffold1532_cov141-Pinguiococcus_pyrenoidosus.AAC.4